jgi:tetratricopeptide (TPR) repeat protein
VGFGPTSSRDRLAGMRRWLGWALAIGLVIATPTLVRAQGADESMDTEAHALFEAGRTAFSAGRFVDALAHFQSAYDLSHRAVLLYNIGQCHDRLRHDTEALAAFEGYLEAIPDAPQRGEVESRIAILREATARSATTATTETQTETETEVTPPVVTPPDEPPQSEAAAPVAESHDAGAGPWVLLGVGAAVAIAGAILVGVAFSDISTVENAPANSDFSAVRDAYDQAPVLSGVGWASLGVGAAMAVVGIVWGVAGSSSGGGEHAELHVVPGGLSLTGAF